MSEPVMAKYQPAIEQTYSNESKAEHLARLFHTNYEWLAPMYGYETRKESAVLWENVPEKNKKLMIAVAQMLLDTHVKFKDGQHG